MTQVISDARCPQCGGRALVFFDCNTSTSDLMCQYCGCAIDKDDKTLPGYGAFACSKEQGGIVQHGAFAGPAEEPYTAEELEKMGFAWYSKRNEAGQWVGVVVKGAPTKEWPEGILPEFDPDQKV